MDEEHANLLKLANIDVDSVQKTVQILSFEDDSSEASNLKMIELDKHLLKIIEEDDNISFRGSNKEELVFCSKDQTFDVKLADVSNSLLLTPNLQFPNEFDQNTETNFVQKETYVKYIYHQYYELIECIPRLGKLPTILGPSTFKGLEFEKTIQKEDLYDWNRLTSEIQASDAEIRNAFEDYMIANLDGYYRMVSFEFEARSVTLMLDFVEENSWKPDEVDKKYTYQELSKFIPRSIFDLIFHKFTVPSKLTDSGDQLYKYDEEKCCKLLARVLLTACPKSEYNHFLKAWNLGTPEYMTPKPEYLNGVAIVIHNPSTQKNEIMAFPETNLSDNVQERFSELFKVKERWTFEEISPYLKKLCVGKVNENALLTKYARVSTIDGIKYYCSKYKK